MSRDDTENAGGKTAKPKSKADVAVQFAHKQMIFTDSDDRNPPSLPGPQQ